MKNIKNLRVVGETLNKIKGKIAALVTAVTMFAVAPSVSAEENKVTAQDVVDAMMTGNSISANLTEEEASRLEIEAEQAVKAEGANLLPSDISERYNSLANLSGEERIQQLAVIAGLCDTLLLDGTSNMMTYPEAIQFATVCDKVCGELINAGNTAIYSIKHSERFGEPIYTELEEIAKQARENKDRKKQTYLIAGRTDLGFYDHCFLGEQDQNMPTGEKENKAVNKALLVSSVLIASGIIAGAKGKEKEEKGTAYTKTNR